MEAAKKINLSPVGMDRETGHGLIIRSLRDIIAECSCGKWTMSSPSSDGQTDEELRARIDSQYRPHQERYVPLSG